MLYLLPFAYLLAYFGLIHHVKTQGGGERFTVVCVENSSTKINFHVLTTVNLCLPHPVYIKKHYKNIFYTLIKL